MKKFLFVFALGCVLAVASSSCKSHETCPAYGAIDTEASVEVELAS